MASIPLRFSPRFPAINGNLILLYCGTYSPTCGADTLPKLSPPSVTSQRLIVVFYTDIVNSRSTVRRSLCLSHLISSCSRVMNRHLFKQTPHRSTTRSASRSSCSCTLASYPLSIFTGVSLQRYSPFCQHSSSLLFLLSYCSRTHVICPVICHQTHNRSI